MESLYSLYDALISINVPNDRARAVVDAMERDMGTTLATKLDLRNSATREDMVGVRGELREIKQDLAAVKQDVAVLKQDVTALKQDVTGLRQEVGALRQDLDARFALLRQEIDTTRKLLAKDIEAMRSSIVIWLGSAIVVAAGVVFAAMRVF